MRKNSEPSASPLLACRPRIWVAKRSHSSTLLTLKPRYPNCVTLTIRTSLFLQVCQSLRDRPVLSVMPLSLHLVSCSHVVDVQHALHYIVEEQDLLFGNPQL